MERLFPVKRQQLGFISWTETVKFDVYVLLERGPKVGVGSQ